MLGLFYNKIYEQIRKRPFLFIALIAIEAAVGWLLRRLGADNSIFSQFLYIPIVIGAIIYDYRVGMVLGAVGGILIGPFLTFLPQTDFVQGLVQWLVGTAFMVLSGGLVGILNRYLVRYYTRSEFLEEHDLFSEMPNRQAFLNEINNRITEGAAFTAVLVEIKNLDELVNTFGFNALYAFLQNISVGLRRDMNGIGEVSLVRMEVLGITCGAFSPRLEKELFHFFSQSIPVHNTQAYCDVAVGTASYPGDAKEAEELLQRALIALEHANKKNLRKARFKEIGIEQNVLAVHLLGELPTALKKGQLDFHYQPLLAAKSSKPAAVEALLRWYHPTYGLIPPLHFIQDLEHTGLVNDLLDWALLANCRRLQELVKELPDLGLVLNITATNLQQEDLAEKVSHYLKKFDCQPKRLVLQLTEVGQLKKQILENESLQELQKLGVRFCLDIYSSNFAAIAEIGKLLEGGILNIDKAFTKGIDKDTRKQYLLVNILRLAHDLHMQTIAEGIESQAELDLLSAMGCDYLQGYFIAYPMPYDEFVEWAKKPHKKRK